MSDYMTGEWQDLGAQLGASSYGAMPPNALYPSQVNTPLGSLGAMPGSPWGSIHALMSASMPGFGQGAMGAGAPFSVASPMQTALMNAFPSGFEGGQAPRNGAPGTPVPAAPQLGQTQGIPLTTQTTPSGMPTANGFVPAPTTVDPTQGIFAGTPFPQGTVGAVPSPAAPPGVIAGGGGR